MEVSGGPLALEPDEFTETNVLKEATRSCPTQDQCGGGLCARGLRKPNVNSWPPSFPGPLFTGRVATPATAAGEHQNRSWRFTFDTLVEIASQDSADLHAQVADEQQERDANGPPLGALVVDMNVGDCEIGARLVGRPAEVAGHHALDGPRGVQGTCWVIT